MFGKGSNVGPHRACNLNLEEQKSQVYHKLWTSSKDPSLLVTFSTTSSNFLCFLYCLLRWHCGPSQSPLSCLEVMWEISMPLLIIWSQILHCWK